MMPEEFVAANVADGAEFRKWRNNHPHQYKRCHSLMIPEAAIPPAFDLQESPAPPVQAAIHCCSGSGSLCGSSTSDGAGSTSANAPGARARTASARRPRRTASAPGAYARPCSSRVLWRASSN